MYQSAYVCLNESACAEHGWLSRACQLLKAWCEQVSRVSVNKEDQWFNDQGCHDSNVGTDYFLFFFTSLLLRSS